MPPLGIVNPARRRRAHPRNPVLSHGVSPILATPPAKPLWVLLVLTTLPVLAPPTNLMLIEGPAAAGLAVLELLDQVLLDPSTTATLDPYESTYGDKNCEGIVGSSVAYPC